MKKSPVSRLNELGDSNGFEAKYYLQTTEGESHSRSFVYRCNINGFNSTGFGSSKQRAKHHTASVMLGILFTSDVSLIKKDVVFSDWDPKDDEEFWKSPEVVNENDENTNAVGELLALCVKLKLGAPQFEDSDVIPKKNSFVVTCFIREFNGLKCEGEGSKKQIAKREAALKMIQILSNLELTRSKQAFMFEEKYTEFEDENVVEDGADETVIRNFVSKLNGSLKKSECELQSPIVDNIPEIDEPLIDYCEQLKKWAENNDFKIEYLRIPSISKSYRHQCLLKVNANNGAISNSPMFTVWGTTNAACISANYNTAMQDAARRVLSFVESGKETYEAFKVGKLGDNISS